MSGMKNKPLRAAATIFARTGLRMVCISIFVSTMVATRGKLITCHFRATAHGYHAGIITEEFDDRLGEKEAENGTNRQKYRAAFDAEKECLLHTLVQLGS